MTELLVGIDVGTTSSMAEVFDVDDGLRISSACPDHGVHAIIDPFEGAD